MKEMDFIVGLTAVLLQLKVEVAVDVKLTFGGQIQLRGKGAPSQFHVFLFDATIPTLILF